MFGCLECISEVWAQQQWRLPGEQAAPPVVAFFFLTFSGRDNSCWWLFWMCARWPGSISAPTAGPQIDLADLLWQISLSWNGDAQLPWRGAFTAGTANCAVILASLRIRREELVSHMTVNVAVSCWFVGLRSGQTWSKVNGVVLFFWQWLQEAQQAELSSCLQLWRETTER